MSRITLLSHIEGHYFLLGFTSECVKSGDRAVIGQSTVDQILFFM